MGLEATAKGIGIQEVLTAPRSPWQNGYVERVIVTIRQECLDHVLVMGETGLRRVLRQSVNYYRRSRTHLVLDKDAPRHRPIASAALVRS